MRKEKYEAERLALLDQVREARETGDTEKMHSLMDQVENLDAEFESIAKSAANAAALSGELVAVNFKNMTQEISGGKVVEKMENKIMAENGIGSQEYKNAFLKTMLGRTDITELENAAYVHTTDGGSAAPMPSTMLDQIWDLVYGEHAIMGDITIYRTGTIMEVVKHTEIVQGKAKKTSENAANDDEQNTFVKVTLTGNDFSKHVDISYAMQKMSLDAFESYLVSEIARGIGEAMAEDAVAAIESGINSANKFNSAEAGAVSFAELVKAFGALKRVSGVTVYATRATIYQHLVGMVDGNNAPIFQMPITAGASGSFLGATIKVEDAVGDGKILIGDPKKVLYNMVQDIMVESDRDIKKHVVTHSGYARGEGVLIDDKAFAELTVS